MSLRRFFVLLGGLSQNSIFVNNMVNEENKKKEIIEDPVEAERFVDKFF